MATDKTTHMTTDIRIGNTREVFAGYLTTSTAETAAGRRVRDLLAELGDIVQDREMASRFIERGTWLHELAREDRDVWEHIAEALTTVSSANMKEDQ